MKKQEDQINLGELIDELARLPMDYRYEGVGFSVDSYRGYYEDLAIWFIESSEIQDTVLDVLEVLRDAVGKTFEGYKGGDFTMDRATAIWLSPYGGGCDPDVVTGIWVDHRNEQFGFQVVEQVW